MIRYFLFFSLIAALIWVIEIGRGEKQLPYVDNSPFIGKLAAFSKKGPRGTTLRLASVTSFAWDTVYFFVEGRKKSIVNQQVGIELFTDPHEYMNDRGPLLVFMADGKVVHAAVILPPLFMAGTEGHGYSQSEAILEAYTLNPGPYLLKFVEKEQIN